MSEPTLMQYFADLMRSLRAGGLKSPVSIQLASKEEAFRIVREIDSEGWLMGSTSWTTVMQDIESGKMQSFLLFGIEFWWRPSIVAVELQQGLKAAA
jgi:hypothetical protein